MRCNELLLNLQEAPINSNKEVVKDFTICGHSSQCSTLINLRGHLLVGISPFNSRFSPGYVKALLIWGHKNFAKVDVLLPDEENTAMLLLATGQPVGKAMRKTRKELNRHRRCVTHVFRQIGESAAHSKIIHYADYEQHPEYQKLKLSSQNSYESCEKFRVACINMSSQAICGRAGSMGGENKVFHSLNNVNLAIPYIFAEMPFYLNSPAFMQVDTSVMAYHRRWPVGDALFSGAFSLRVDKRQGHGIVSVVEV